MWSGSNCLIQDWFPTPVKRNDAVVFNFPANDTLINLPEFGSEKTYYQAIQEDMARKKISESQARDDIWSQYEDYIIVRR